MPNGLSVSLQLHWSHIYYDTKYILYAIYISEGSKIKAADKVISIFMQEVSHEIVFKDRIQLHKLREFMDRPSNVDMNKVLEAGYTE